MILPAAALGGPCSLSGVELYIATWHHDGNYRALVRNATPYAMGGTAPSIDTLVMNDMPVIVRP